MISVNPPKLIALRFHHLNTYFETVKRDFIVQFSKLILEHSVNSGAIQMQTLHTVKVDYTASETANRGEIKSKMKHT